jgi:hypothetical protein
MLQEQARVVFGTVQKNGTSLLFPLMSLKATKRLTAFPLRIDGNQTAIVLPPVTSTVFLIAK